MQRLTRRTILAAAPSSLVLSALPAGAAKQYGPGVTDAAIKIGNTCFYSGPASSYGTIGKAMAAYYKMVNDQGGVNGRKIDFLSYDDAYSPPKTVEQTRRLVEQDGVFLMASPLGTPTNSATQHYLNQKKVPQLFVATGATKWDDPKHFPWTIGWQPNYQSEGHIYAQYLIKNHPGGKVGILYQNDDYGKDYVKGLKDGLSGKLPVVAEVPYETTDPTVDSQIINLKASGADVFYNVATPKFAAQAIKKVGEIGWKPVHLLNGVSANIGAVLKPAGLDNSLGVLSAAYFKDQTDPVWKNDPGYKEWAAFLDRYYPDADRTNSSVVSGFLYAQAMVRVLEQCGDDLTRDNVMRQAANFKNAEFGMLLPGITANTGPQDYAPLKQMQMRRFAGEHWELFGP